MNRENIFLGVVTLLVTFFLYSTLLLLFLGGVDVVVLELIKLMQGV